MTINLGIIGTGAAIPRLHLPALRKLPDAFRVVAVANRTREKAEKLASELGGPKVYEDYHALLADPAVEAVVIAVPIHLNGQVLIDSVKAGKHVLAEKPIAPTTEVGREVLQICQGSPKIVVIGENFRYREDVEKARDLIAAGEIGKVFCFQMSTLFDIGSEFRSPWFAKGTWRQAPAYPGGIFADTSIHMISALRDILGEVKELYVQAQNVSQAIEAQDCFLSQITMSSGAIGQYAACFSAKVPKESVLTLNIYGTSGSLRLTEGELQWMKSPGKEESVYKPENYDRGYTRQWRNFHRAIQGEESVVSTPEEAYCDLLVIDAALRSAETAQRVQVDCGN